MREIKFRGREYNGPWYAGSLVKKQLTDRLVCMIFTEALVDNKYLVDPETVGQFTGLRDADGREIYEGDVVRTDLLPHMRTTVCNGYVEYRNGAFYVEYIDHTYANLGDLIFYSGTSSTVVGNVHDNPELLEHRS